jgi:hypothetical protein
MRLRPHQSMHLCLRHSALTAFQLAVQRGVVPAEDGSSTAGGGAAREFAAQGCDWDEFLSTARGTYRWPFAGHSRARSYRVLLRSCE